MAILKVMILSSLAISSLFAKIDFVKFDDICKKTETQSCKNNPVEIKAIQYLLKRRLNPSIKVTGELDSITKDAIVKLQLKEHIPASGYIGKNTKDALNKLLYGYKLHNIAKVETKSVKKEELPVAKKSNIAISSKIDNSKKAIQLAKKREDLSKSAKVEKKTTKKLAKSIKKERVKVATLKKSNTLKQNRVEATKKVTKLAKNRPNRTNLKAKFTKKIVAKKIVDNKVNFKSYKEFINGVDLKRSYAVYKDDNLLKRAGGKNTLLKVDVSEQRVKLVVNGKVALDAPCTTGSKHKLEPNTRTYRDKRTPLGTFKVMEKIATKRSTIFGNIYKKGKLIYHGDRRKYKGSWRGVKFVGAPLKNWMRLTSSGIGLHSSTHVKRYPGSNGCIRLQPKVATTLFKKIKRGTTVKVVN